MPARFSLEDPVIQKLIRWGQDRPDIRAAILTSSLTNPSAPVDAFSDYDIIYFVQDVLAYHQPYNWLADFGPLLVVYRDPLKVEDGLASFARITQYENGLKIDFTFEDVQSLRRIAAEPALPPDLDVGYQVLFDKDILTAGLQPPRYQAYIPSPPPETEYLRVVEEFFHEGTYVAKHLWRGDLLPAKYNLDQMMKHDNLRPMLEWMYEIPAGWSLKTGAYGKGLRKRLRPEIHAALEATYCGGGMEENWEALFRTVELFRLAAQEVAAGLGYTYPIELDRRVCAYFEKVRRLPHDAQDLSGLASTQPFPLP